MNGKPVQRSAQSSADADFVSAVLNASGRNKTWGNVIAEALYSTDEPVFAVLTHWAGNARMFITTHEPMMAAYQVCIGARAQAVLTPHNPSPWLPNQLFTQWNYSSVNGISVWQPFCEYDVVADRRNRSLQIVVDKAMSISELTGGLPIIMTIDQRDATVRFHDADYGTLAALQALTPTGQTVCVELFTQSIRHAFE